MLAPSTSGIRCAHRAAAPSATLSTRVASPKGYFQAARADARSAIIQRERRAVYVCRMVSTQAASSCHSSRRSTITAARKRAPAGEPGESDDVQVSVDNLSATKRLLTVVVPPNMVENCFETTVSTLRKVVGNMDGFRNGKKVPLSVVMTEVGGPTKFKLTVLEEILMQTMPLVMDQVTDQVIPDSEQITSDIRALADKFDPKKSVTFEIAYDTCPPVTWLRPYKDAEVTVRDSGDFDTDAAAVEDLIRQYLKEKAQQRVVAGRGVQKGDVCICKLKVFSEGGEVPLPGFEQDRATLDTEIDPLNLTPGMLGMTVGEMRKLPIQFPADYKVELWKGMKAEATVTLVELFSYVLPEVDDDFVKASFEGKFGSVEDMKKALLATTTMQRMRDLDKALEDEVMTAVIACIQVDEVPEKLLLDMGANQYQASLMQMIEDLIIKQEDLDSMMTDAMIEEFIEKRRSDLEDMVKFNLVVDDIFAAEGLELSEEDIASECAEREKQYKEQEAEYSPEVLREQIRDTFKHMQVVEWLKDNLKRTVVPWNAA